ncbi:MAG: helix-turn-helix domain-containing protein [Synechococcales cyanobacterium RU_4_20]|nr:helix-turn-helix domain-containing protein [Synechococcales cyanobacterium RU_4_20]NJR68136.1 helix-turn-helix domain-containing protein [Synechococcales cyanobacterium CRU_2_2]
MTDFGTTIRERRRQEGLSQEALAQQVGISRNYLSQIERGLATNLSWQLRQTLTSLLGIQEAVPVVAATPQDLPLGLAEFAQRADLPSDDVLMLTRLRYRGKQPTTADKWELLYNVIKMTVDS